MPRGTAANVVSAQFSGKFFPAPATGTVKMIEPLELKAWKPGKRTMKWTFSMFKRIGPNETKSSHRMKMLSLKTMILSPRCSWWRIKNLGKLCSRQGRDGSWPGPAEVWTHKSSACWDYMSTGIAEGSRAWNLSVGRHGKRTAKSQKKNSDKSTSMSFFSNWLEL